MAVLELAFDRQLLAAKRLPINRLDEARLVSSSQTATGANAQY
jgi:hypothetical protein